MSDKPRAFLFMPYIPFPVDRGTYQRVYHLFVELSKSFEIDFACLQEDPTRDMEPFAAYTQRRLAIPFKNAPWPKLFPERLMNPLPTTVAHWQVDGVFETLQDFVAGQEYARIIFIDLVLWPYIKGLFPHHSQIVMDRSRVDWLFQTEELNTLPLGLRDRLLRKENLSKIARLEREAYAAIAGMIVCGWDDRDFLQTKLGESEKIFVLANGYNEVFFDASTHPRQLTEAPSFLFCGALDYSPNVDAINWFAQDIWPLIHAEMPDAIWRIIGKSPDARSEAWGRLEGVELVGEVPDVRPYYQSSWAQVVPLRIGGGTRLKIVESLGMCCPVVSTTLGAQGLDIPPEEAILLADEPRAFADALMRVLRETALRQRLEQNGLKVVKENYRWEQLGRKLTNYLKTL
ncbi:glycosyltransferase [Coraliomargarita algicola]|uniref:Glycosyltransferase n=1 Tax=Coraliomargarita algicola TaxID=3092156 RepID=A0ABZ0RV42_9BACT|nr:glycosyltransferase [Coraliomargarita sp. J2-16]WPJ96829.1 glycosyltransferase [Coraliomargarita sp. J2-16]